MADGLDAAVALDGWPPSGACRPGHLAFAFALDHPRLASVLFGATSVAQLEANVGAVTTYRSLDAAQLGRLGQSASLGTPTHEQSASLGTPTTPPTGR